MKVELVVDSGTYSALRLYRPYVQKYGIVQTGPTLDSFAFGLGGKFPEKLGRIGALRIGTLALNEPATSLSEAKRGVTASGGYDGTIEGAILCRFKIIFDYSGHQMILEPNADFAEPFAADTSGVILEASGAGLKTIRALHVLPSTPAAAGIREGDVLVSVNDEQAQALSLEGVRGLFLRTGTYRLRLRREEQDLAVEMKATKPLY